MLDKLKDYKYIFDVDYKQETEQILGNILECLPGIEIVCLSKYLLFFTSQSQKGLFFLGRSVDKRYGGLPWNISISIADQYKYDDKYPIIYKLETNTNILSLPLDQSSKVDDEIIKIIENMTYYLNHEIFLKEYDMSINDFKIISMRSIKLKRIIKL